MKGILLLTKNIEYEQNFSTKLRNLGYEVFVSNNVLDDIIEKNRIPTWIDGFSVVIISETLSKKETNLVGRILTNNRLICVLKTEDPILGLEQKTSEIEYAGLIYKDAKLTDVSTAIEQLDSIRGNGEVKFIINSNKKDICSLDVLENSLTKTNSDIYNMLKKQNGGSISRERLAEKIWGTCTNSNLSQLSLRIKNLNIAIDKITGIQHAIVTEWGKGYSLSDYFCKNYVSHT